MKHKRIQREVNCNLPKPVVQSSTRTGSVSKIEKSAKCLLRFCFRTATRVRSIRHILFKCLENTRKVHALSVLFGQSGGVWPMLKLVSFDLRFVRLLIVRLFLIGARRVKWCILCAAEFLDCFFQVG